MLPVETRFMIKDLFRQGVSISEIARSTGHDRKTIRQALRAPLLVRPAPRPPRSAKIAPYVPYLEQRLTLGVFNAHKLFGEIQAQGYPGQETQVRAWVAARRPPRSVPATLRFETAPGEQAQCDWGHFGTIRVAGVQRWLYGFVMTLGWSRVSYLEFTTSVEAAWWLRCHLHAFAYFGGIPQQVLHDNLKTAVIDRDPDGTIRWNARYLDFAAQVGFTPRACAPYRAQTKGKVESGVGYVRKNFWPGLLYSDLPDLNRQALGWLDGVANRRVHGTTGVVPFSRLAAEGLRPLPVVAYDTSDVVARRSSRDCLISYDGNFYSVPAAYAGCELVVKVSEAGGLSVYTPQGQEIAHHQLSGGHHDRVVVAAHYAGLPARSVRPQRAQAHQQEPRLEALWAGAPVVEQRSLAVYDELLAVGA